tara:strand:- start:5447 stop:5827 length:381 start_codon:yes stop_codon:yes gene_type:complete
MKFISYISIMGLIPFFLCRVEFISEEFLIKNFDIYYGFMISGFLFGMQWVRALEGNRVFYEKIMPVLAITLMVIIINFEIELKFIVILALCLALLTEVGFQGKFLSKKYIYLRFIVTILATYSFFI